MSRSKRIFGLIKKELPGVELCKDMLVVLPTEHILRGFLLEATIEKDRYLSLRESSRHCTGR